MSNSDITVKFQLRGGHKLSASLAKDSAELNLVKRWRRGEIAEGFVLQIPSSKDRGNTAFSIGDIVEASFAGQGEHPAMNVSEGHLGGYISARHTRSEELGVLNGDPATYTPDLWRWLVEELGVASVLDVGCGEGHAAAFFAGLGCSVAGMDGSFTAFRDSVIQDHHLRHDFNNGPFIPNAAYDLVWSCEFVEHVEARFIDNFMTAFDAATRYLLMTAAPPGQQGWHHVNCQPSEYWIDRIEPRGFRFDSVLTKTARSMAIGGHFASQGLCFTRI